MEVYGTGGGPLNCARFYLESEADGFNQARTQDFNPPVGQWMYDFKQEPWNMWRPKAPNLNVTSAAGAGNWWCGLVSSTSGWDIYNYADTTFSYLPYGA